jgi:hypothetical protein
MLLSVSFHNITILKSGAGFETFSGYENMNRLTVPRITTRGESALCFISSAYKPYGVLGDRWTLSGPGLGSVYAKTQLQIRFVFVLTLPLKYVMRHRGDMVTVFY